MSGKSSGEESAIFDLSYSRKYSSSEEDIIKKAGGRILPFHKNHIINDSRQKNADYPIIELRYLGSQIIMQQVIKYNSPSTIIYGFKKSEPENNSIEVNLIQTKHTRRDVKNFAQNITGKIGKKHSSLWGGEDTRFWINEVSPQNSSVKTLQQIGE